MEPHSWSLEPQGNSIPKKRQAFLDEAGVDDAYKRVCAEQFPAPIELDALPDVYSSIPFWLDNSGTINSYHQYIETTSELANSVEGHSSTPFRDESSVHDPAHPLLNHGGMFGAGHCTAIDAPTSIADFPFKLLDTQLAAQAQGPGPSAPAAPTTVGPNDDAYLCCYANSHDVQIQQLNNLEFSGTTNPFDSNIDVWANSSAFPSRQSDPSSQEMVEYLLPDQSRNFEMSCLSVNVGGNRDERSAGSGLSAKSLCMYSEGVVLESESTMNMETESTSHTPVSSEYSITGMDGKLNECNRVSDIEPFTDPSAVPRYDACFGVVMTTATSSFKSSSGLNRAPVSITAFGDILKLSFQDSNKYAGLITSPTLSMLLRDYCIQFSATLMAPHDKLNQARMKTKSQETHLPQECPVRIIIYGLVSERATVGKRLSDVGLYLQHPSPSEFDRNVTYLNPHYLLRPGAQMPNLEELSIASDSGCPRSSVVFDEANKSRFMRIFDLANEVASSLTVEASCRLCSALKNHQLTALAMMREKELGLLNGCKFPPLWEVLLSPDATVKYRHTVTGVNESSPKPVYGGILADEMGLGKTLSLLALICWSLDSLSDNLTASNDEHSRVTLIITPKSTIYNWQDEIERHIHRGQLRLAIYHGSARTRLSKELQNVDIVLTTYETMRSDWAAKGELYSQRWYRIVLDEAHHIRTRSSQTFQAACAIMARYRWCLTGTPIHNSLDDYGALLSFIGVQPFSDKAAFDFWITEPIKQSQPNSLRRLEALVRATCLRRKKSLNDVLFQLPQRSEKVQWIKLLPEDKELYKFFKLKTAKIASELARRHSGSRENTNIITLINFLRLICDHGEHLLPPSALQAWKTRNSGSIDWQMMRGCRVSCDMCGAYVDESDAPSPTDLEFQCQHLICPECVIRSQEHGADEDPACPECIRQTGSGGYSMLPTKNSNTVRPSAKVNALIQNLLQEQSAGSEGDMALPNKSLVFSSWTKMLDLVQHHLEMNGFTIQRIDGQSSLKQRREAISQFNQDPNYTVMLASIGSAGEGVDLKAANYVHLLEPHWNPMAETQAMDRVHRIGQRREVRTTRYITEDSIETYVQWIQQEKIRLINQSLDSVHVSQAEIDEQRWKKLQLYMDCTAGDMGKRGRGPFWGSGTQR